MSLSLVSLPGEGNELSTGGATTASLIWLRFRSCEVPHQPSAATNTSTAAALRIFPSDESRLGAFPTAGAGRCRAGGGGATGGKRVGEARRGASKVGVTTDGLISSRIDGPRTTSLCVSSTVMGSGGRHESSAVRAMRRFSRKCCALAGRSAGRFAIACSITRMTGAGTPRIGGGVSVRIRFIVAQMLSLPENDARPARSAYNNAPRP